MAEDGSGSHSPFTSALLKHLPVPGLDVRFVFGRVRDEVWKSTGYRQEPSIYGSLGGDIISIVPAQLEQLPARVPDSDGTRGSQGRRNGVYESGLYTSVAVETSSTIRGVLVLTAQPIASPLAHLSYCLA
jgi:hypothetical protein